VIRSRNAGMRSGGLRRQVRSGSRDILLEDEDVVEQLLRAGREQTDGRLSPAGARAA